MSKTREFITTPNGSGLCISYTSMKKYRNDLVKFAVANSLFQEITTKKEMKPNRMR